MFRLVFVLATWLVLAVATGCNLPSSSIRKKKSDTLTVGSSTTLMTITSVNQIVSNNVDTLEVIGSDFNSWCLAATGATAQPTTCSLEIREQTAPGVFTSQNVGTELVENNILRFVAPPALSPAAFVRVFVQQVNGYSNELQLGGSSLAGATDDIHNYVRVKRYQAAFVHHPVNPLSGLVDGIERDSHETIYNLYTTNPGRAMLLIGVLSNSQQAAMQRFRFSFEPTFLDSFVPVDPAQRAVFAKWRNLVVGAQSAPFECENATSAAGCTQNSANALNTNGHRNSLGWFEWDPGAVTSAGYTGVAPNTPVVMPTPASGSPKRHLDFYVAERRFSVFDTPVHAMVAPDVQSFAPPQQVAGLVDPLGFAARPVVNGANLTCPSTASYPLPEGFIWAKVVPFCFDRAPQRGIRAGTDAIGDSVRNKGDIVCNPGRWDPSVPFSSEDNNFVPDCTDPSSANGCSLEDTAPGYPLQTLIVGSPTYRCGGYATRIFGDRNSPLNSACFRFATRQGQPVLLPNLDRLNYGPSDWMTRIYGHPLSTSSPNVTINTTAWGMSWPAPAASPAPVPGNVPANVNPIQSPHETTAPQSGALDGQTPHKDCLFVVLPETMQASEIFGASGTAGSSNCNVAGGAYCPVSHMFVNDHGTPGSNRYPTSYVPIRPQVGDVSTGTGVYPLCVITRKVD